MYNFFIIICSCGVIELREVKVTLVDAPRLANPKRSTLPVWPRTALLSYEKLETRATIVAQYQMAF